MRRRAAPILRRKLIQTFVEAISLTVGALLPVMNPFSTAPLFVSLTANFEPRRRRGQAIRACAYAFAILVTFLLAGAAIIDFFGISIPGIRSAGGLIILAIGSRMLFPAAKAAGYADSPDAAPDLDVAFSPLAMPSLAGPGSIAVVMSAAAQIRSERPNDWALIYAAVIAGMAATLVVSYLVLRLAGTMVRFMRRAGIDAMTRIFGFLLICIGMQFLLTGIADFYGLDVGSAPAAQVSPGRAEGPTRLPRPKSLPGISATRADVGVGVRARLQERAGRHPISQLV